MGVARGAESGAYLRYVSIYDTSKVQKESIGTIYRTKGNNLTNKKLPRGKIGGDETIFGRCAGAESGAYLRYVSIYDTSKVQKESIGTIYKTKGNNLTNKKTPKRGNRRR